MGWDQSRVVPWQSLVREWLIYVLIMALIFLIVFRESGFVGALTGLLISGPLYVGFGAVMAKFGYRRKSLKQLRTPQAGSDEETPDDDDGDHARRRPAPTKRTSGGGNRPKSRQRRR